MNSLLVTCFLTAKDVVNVENVITVLIVVSIVLDALAGFGQHATGVP